MPILELCAGYGGLGMAVEALTGDKVAYVADNDEAASLVLAHRLPGVPNIGDISAYDWQQLFGLVDIIAAGFSCQDISNAGPREGISGSRSRVWKDVAEAVRVIRPRLVFLENVSAIRSRGLDVVVEDLAAIGYDLWWTCLRASTPAVGAAHHRDRWFAIAVPDAEGERRPPRGAEPAKQQGEVRRSAGACRELPADANSQGLEVGGVESARAERPTPERGSPGPEDAYGAARPERVGSAPGQAARGGARTDPR